MQRIVRYSIFIYLALFLSGCSQRDAGQDESTVMRSKPPGGETSWITNLAGRLYGEYACSSFRQARPEDFEDQHLFPGVLLQRYGVERIYVSVWTNMSTQAAGPVTVYCARFPSDLHAYGVYSSIPRGVDQTALRGGPSKRLGRTLVALKDLWVVWTLPALKDKRPILGDYELVFSGICLALPGSKWILPQDVRTLGTIMPAPEEIEFRPENYLGLSFLNAAVCARYRTASGSVELFGILPQNRSEGVRQIKAFKQWLADQDITAVFVEKDDTMSLYVNDGGIEPIYMVADSHGLRGVRGLDNIPDAQALLARWVPQDTR